MDDIEELAFQTNLATGTATFPTFQNYRGK